MRARFAITTLLVAIVSVGLYRSLVFELGHVEWAQLGTDCRADGLLIGALAAQLRVRSGHRIRIPSFATAVSIAFLVAASIFAKPATRFVVVPGYTLVAIATATIVLALVTTPGSLNSVLASAPLRAVGRTSYGLYLWHPLVFNWVLLKTFTWSVPSRMVLAAAITITVTTVSWWCIERPFLAWKNHLETGTAAGSVRI